MKEYEIFSYKGIERNYSCLVCKCDCKERIFRIKLGTEYANGLITLNQYLKTKKSRV